MQRPAGSAASRGRTPIALALLCSACLLAARLAAAPAVSDPTGAPLSPSLHLDAPLWYLIFAPLFTLWDGVSMLSQRRLAGFLLGLVGLYVVWRLAAWMTRPSRRRGWLRAGLREAGVLAISLAAFMAFALGGALWHRPMLALAGVPDSMVVVDFHSHTSASHDVEGTLMDAFDAEANRRWHDRARFDVAFVTDHNVVADLPPRPAPGRFVEAALVFPSGQARRRPTSAFLCPGIEISSWRAHVVLLGKMAAFGDNVYRDDLDGFFTLIESSEGRYNAPTIASIPEYARNHWMRLDTLVAMGLDGFEVVNASPKANELSRRRRDSVIALARAHDRFIVGVSDSHGWGATSMVWNLMDRPSGNSRAERCAGIVQQLQRDGFEAVQIVERHRLRPDDDWPIWLTPAGVVWETWRGMGWPLTLSWLMWVWVVAGVAVRRVE